MISNFPIIRGNYVFMFVKELYWSMGEKAMWDDANLKQFIEIF